MNPQRDRGIRAEREACKILTTALCRDVRRRANEGIREDIGDLVGVPDTTIQVSAVPDRPAIIAARAATKTVDVEKQRARAGTTMSVVVLRIDGGDWRAVLTTRQLRMLIGDRIANQAVFVDPPSPGLVIRWAPRFSHRDWCHVTGDVWVGTLLTWAACWRIAHFEGQAVGGHR